MSREIKFRVWDKDNKKMRQWEDLMIDKDEGDNEICFYSKAEEGEWNGGLDVELMQYTGLRDKNGKEIFESDILMLNNNKLDLVQICFGEFGVRDIETEVAIDGAVGWYMKPIKTDKLSTIAPFCYDSVLNDFWIKRTQAKVIGNIYENPKLLKR